VSGARRRVAVVGGGWAGLAAAVEATRLGHAVTLLEMAPQLGGRARTVTVDGLALDNGQHIAIGAYVETLALLRTLGVPEHAAFQRRRLELLGPDGTGLALGPGPPSLAFALAVLRHPRWGWRDKLSVLRAAGAWRRSGFRCDPAWTVARLAAPLTATAREELIEPLCVAALNTPAHEAGAATFLRVLGDALFGGRGHADLLLPSRPLGAVLPEPAERWLLQHGAQVRCGARVEGLAGGAQGWRAAGFEDPVDRVVLATPPREAGRLVAGLAPAWSATAHALAHEPIVTVYLRSPGVRLPAPMLALSAASDRPAQFVFDRGQLGGPAGLLAFVISGAAPWVEAGHAATLSAVRRQAASLPAVRPETLEVVQVVSERRATLRCVPGLVRPPMQIAPGLLAAGDYVEGPYPSTLEGAVRSGIDAARAL
jgi:squalene-associated FAD-dependent desaturase